MSEEPLYFNGLNGTTGTYDMPDMTPDQMVNSILDSSSEDDHSATERKERFKRQTLTKLHDVRQQWLHEMTVGKLRGGELTARMWRQGFWEALQLVPVPIFREARIHILIESEATKALQRVLDYPGELLTRTRQVLAAIQQVTPPNPPPYG